MGMSKKTESEIVTVTRASTKWVFDATGTLVEVPVDQLAHDYDPVTGEYRGVLVEGERTNVFHAGNAVAVFSPGYRYTYELDGGVLYAGTPASKLTKIESTGQCIHTFVKAFDGRVAVQVAFRLNGAVQGNILVRDNSVGVNLLQATIDATGSTTITQGTGDATGVVEGGGWVRLQLLPEASVVAGSQVRVYLADSNTSIGDVFHVAGIQYEEATTPTSYIPTSGTAVTRTADDISRLFNAEYNPQQGTWIADIDAVDANLLRGIGLDGLRLTGKGTLVYRYDETGGAVFIDGAKVFDTPPISRPELLSLGDDRGSVHVRDVRYRPYAFTDNEAQTAAVGAISVDYPFEQGQSLSLGFDVQDYGKRAHQDSLDAVRTSDAKNLLSVTRATTKWVFDASGTLAEVPVDQPAYDHDPVTGEALGVLIEESRTNLVTYSEAFDNAAWDKDASTSVTANTDTAPDGKLTADTLTTDGSGIPSIRANTSVSADTTTYVMSVFLKKTIDATEFPLVSLGFSGGTDQNNQYAGINTNDGSVIATNGTLVVLEVADCRDYWKVVVSNQNNGTNTSCATSVFVNRMDAAGTMVLIAGSCVAWGAQLEEGVFPTSYTPTAGSAVTRSADDFSRALGGEFKSDTGTVFVEFECPPPPKESYDTTTVLSLDDPADNDNRLIQIRRMSDGKVETVTRIDQGPGGSWTQYAVLAAVGHQTGDFLKAAASYNGQDFVAATAGVSAQATVGFDPAIPGVLNVGNQSGNRWFMTGHIKRLEYYPRAMTAAELEALTA